VERVVRATSAAHLDLLALVSHDLAGIVKQREPRRTALGAVPERPLDLEDGAVRRLEREATPVAGDECADREGVHARAQRRGLRPQRDGNPASRKRHGEHEGGSETRRSAERRSSDQVVLLRRC
jgi:hypothetical protein